MALGDLNGDGFSDLVVSSVANNTIAIYLNSGSGTFSTDPVQILPIYASSFVIADFDRDGMDDIAAFGAFGIEILHGLGDGTVRRSQSFLGQPLCPVGFLSAGDLDGDGTLDLVASRPDRTSLRLFMNKKGAGFEEAASLTIPLAASIAVWRPSGAQETEILALSVEPPLVRVFRKSSIGWEIGSPITLPHFGPGWGGSMGRMDVGDVNQDGVQDLMISKDGVPEIRLLFGNRSGGFEPCKVWPTPIAIQTSCLLRRPLKAALQVGYGYAALLVREEASTNASWQHAADLPPGYLIKAECQRDQSDLIVAIDSYGLAHVFGSHPIAAPRRDESPFKFSDPRYDPARAPSFTSRVWSAADGLPGNSVRSILQTSDGYVWVGTTEGLARFDGDTFRRWGVNSNGTVFNRSCEALAEDPKGRLWVGYLRGLMRIEGDSIVENYVTNLTDPRIFSLNFSRAGDLWVSEFQGVERLRNGIFERVFDPDAPTIALSGALSAVIAPPDQIILTTGRKVFRFDGSRKDSPGQCLHSPMEMGAVSRVVAAGANGEVYVGDELGGIGVISTNRFHGYFLRNVGWPEDGPLPISALAFCPNGTLWIGTRGGLYVLRDGELARVSDIPSLRDRVTALHFDQEQNLWVGTENYGVILLRFPTFETFTSKHGLSGNAVNTLAESGDKILWVGGETGIFTNIADGFKAVGLPEAIHPKAFSAVSPRSNGQVWFGGDSGHHQILTKAGFVSERDFGPVDHVCFQELHDHRTVMISDAGVAWYDEKAGSSGPPILTGISARNAFEDSKGGVWLGTIAGLFHFDRKTTLVRPVEAAVLTGRCEVALEDSQSALWIISDQGLARLKDGRCSLIRTDAGLFEENLLSMLDDRAGNFWFGTSRGIFRVEASQLNLYVQGNCPHVECIHYGLDDGLLSEQCSYGHPASCRSHDGMLWFATARGLLRIDPKRAVHLAAAPKVFFDEISDETGVLYRRFASGGSARDAASSLLRIKNGNERALLLQFSSPRFSIHGSKTFEYRLKGLETNWTQSTVGKAFYAYLPPGGYTFEVRAENANGLWSQPLSVPIRIPPLLTQRRDFYLFTGGLCGVFLVTLAEYRRRTRRQIQLLRERTVIAEERSRIARDLHDDIGASLTQIAMASEIARSQLTGKEEEKAIEREMEKLSGLARGAVENMSHIIWSTNPKFDTLSSLIAYLREYTVKSLPESMEARFEGAIGEEIHVSSEFRANLFYLVKEALANILKHSAASTVLIQMKSDRGRLQIKIQDDGRGFVPNERMLSSTGLDSMKKRATDLHGEFNILSEAQKGTVIVVSIPLDSRGCPEGRAR